MYRLITFILLCANICIADIFAATVKECEVDSMYNDTLIVGKNVICGQKIYPQRDDVITACLAHERRLYLVGKLKDTLLVITDDPALFSNDAFCDVNFKHFKSPYYKPEFGISDSRFSCYVGFPTDAYYIYPPNNMDGKMQNCKVQMKFTL